MRLVTRFSLLLVCLLAVESLTAQPLNTHLLQNFTPRSIGPAGMSGRVTAIDVVQRQPELIYAGTASGGLWFSDNAGIAWKPIFDDQKVASIGAIGIFQANPDVVWVGTGEGNPRNSQTSGNGVYRSLDGGKTWRHMGLENSRNIHRIVVHPSNPDVVYVGVQGSAWGDHPERGVFRTRNGGATWEKILYKNERTGIADLVMDPGNPNKLIAAMWEFHRDAWFFQSGGKGSGLYVSWDGGDTWEARDSTDGLPEGEFGRMGVAIARSNPSVVYAMVESKKNGLYRSDDGGTTFKLVNGNDVGGRPFYYSEIYVDPANENRVYDINTSVSVSNDGGKSFTDLLPYYGNGGIHPDHHAWYVLPSNPNYILEGNDGGLSISQDKGKTWRFVENLPLAQYYHINVDMDLPYHVYGGMQDNGSWRGPAYVWRSGGIRNSYFEEVMFGDGFDVVPDPRNSEVGYAMSQGGSLGRYDLGNNTAKFIQPKHPEGKYLRFNWNTGIAMDPFDPNTIYYGSQYLHKSTDRGESWSIISPDLTSNDSTKQNFLKSGGLTPDVTAAETHTTILTIAPSPLQSGVIWVGTDDGNVQLTRDGGKTWTLVSKNIVGVPAATWVPQIRASTYNEAEAWVVFDNHRRNDWTPYAFRTRDFGKTWEKIVATDKVWGYCHSILQDPVEPKLLFLGTEFGLYVSTDEGKSWAKYTNGYPTVATMDFVVHPREADLVIATFGRAAYVFDDIRPLRAIAATAGKALTDTVHVFTPPVAVLTEFSEAPGIRFTGDAMFQGQNRRRGAMISYSVLKGNAPRATGSASPSGRGGRNRSGGPATSGGGKSDSATVEIFNADGQLIRTFYHLPDSGLNRVYWDLCEKGNRRPGSDKPTGKVSDPSGVTVLPGKFAVKITYQGASDATQLEVILDPRVVTTPEALVANRAFARKAEDLYPPISEVLDRIEAANGSIELIQKQFTPSDSLLRKATSAMEDSLKLLELLIVDNSDKKGYQEDTTTLLNRIQLGYYLYSNPYDAPNATHELLYQQALTQSVAVVDRIRRFFEVNWAAYKLQVLEARLSPFKE